MSSRFFVRYCECFASGLYCERCNCSKCCNNSENSAARQEAIDATLDRNSNAFRPKVLPTPSGDEEAEGRHNKERPRAVRVECMLKSEIFPGLSLQEKRLPKEILRVLSGENILHGPVQVGWGCICLFGIKHKCHDA